MQEVQQELESSRTKIVTLEKSVSERDKRIERLEAEARSQRKRWLDESRAQSQTMNNLRAELEAKANNIAYLTTELHRLKQKGRNEQQNSDQGNSIKNAGTVNPNQPVHSMVQGAASHPGYLHPESTGTKSSFGHHMPTPPTREKTLGGTSASRVRRSGQSRATMTGGVSGKALHPTSAEALAGRQANPLRLSSGRSSGSESPDITPFLPTSKEEFVKVVGGKQAPILPPIAASAVTGPVLVHQVVSSSSQHRQMAKATEAAIESLAVENAVPDTAWPIAHESRSSEFK